MTAAEVLERGLGGYISRGHGHSGSAADVDPLWGRCIYVFSDERLVFKLFERGLAYEGVPTVRASYRNIERVDLLVLTELVSLKGAQASALLRLWVDGVRHALPLPYFIYSVVAPLVHQIVAEGL